MHSAALLAVFFLLSESVKLQLECYLVTALSTLIMLGIYIAFIYQIVSQKCCFSILEDPENLILGFDFFFCSYCSVYQIGVHCLYLIFIYPKQIAVRNNHGDFPSIFNKNYLSL